MPRFQYQSDARVIIPVSMPTTLLRELNRLATERRVNRSELVRQALAVLIVGPGVNPSEGDERVPV